MSSFNWSPVGGGGSGNGIATYATLADFPSAATAGNGAQAIALDTNILYESNGVAWQVIAGPGIALSVGTFGSSPNANGLTISGTVLHMQPADATNPGGVSTGAQTIAGVKTFNSAPNLSSLTASTALVLDGSKNIASSSTTATELGYVHGVTSAIQTQLDGKQATGNYITALTGDGTASGPGSTALTLATVNGSPGTFGSASTSLSATVNAKGLITALSSQAIQITESQVTNLTTDLASKVPLIWETNTIFYNAATYATLQAAVDAAELLSGSAITNATGVTIILPDGDFSAQSVLIKKNVNFIGQGATATYVGTITYRPTDSTHSPQTVSLTNLKVNNLAAYNETAGGGVFDPNMLYTNGLFVRGCIVNSTITFNRLNKVFFANTQFFSTYAMDLCEVIEFDACITSGNSILWTTNDAASNLPTSYSGGNLSFRGGSIAGVTLTKTGGSIEAYYNAVNTFISVVTRNGDTQINMTGGGVGTFVDSGSNNTFTDWYSHGPYTPATPGNWTSTPTFIDDALDLLAANRVRAVGNVGAVPNAAGASISGYTLTLQPADGSNPGVITAGTQTIGGAKTFSSTISASNLSGTNTGDLTLAAIGSSPNANGASLSSQVLTLQPASASFGGIVTTGTQTIAGAKTLSNDLTLSTLLALPTTSSTAGQITLNGNRWAHAYGTNNIFIGSSAGNFTLTTANGVRNVALGNSALTALTATSSGADNTCIGDTAGNNLTTGFRNTFVGSAAGAGANNTVARGNTFIGYSTGANGTGVQDCTLVGSGLTATASNQVIIGTTAGVNNVYFGKGVTSSSAGDVVISPTGGTGSNNAGGALTLAAGISTGNASPALINFQTTTVGSTGSTAQTLSTRGGFDGAGGFFQKGTTSGTLTHKAAATTTDYTLTYPSAAAAGAVSVDGSGNMAFGVLSIANGGTNNGSLGVTNGGVIYTDGTKLANTGAGSSGNYLKSVGAGAPVWEKIGFFNGFLVKDNNWSTTSATFADPSAGSAPTLTTKNSVNMGTVVVEATGLCGITFTAEAAIYEVEATVIVVSSGVSTVSARIVDGSGTDLSGGISQVITGAGNQECMTILGSINASAGSVTLKIQLAVNNGTTASISTGGASTGASVQWKVRKVV